MTMTAAPSVLAGSTLAPTSTTADSPALTADRQCPQLFGSISMAGSHFDPNTLTSKASPSPTLTMASRPILVGPSPAPLDSRRFAVSRASSRRTARGRSNHRNPIVTTADTTAAVGITPSHSSQLIDKTLDAGRIRRRDAEALLSTEASA